MPATTRRKPYNLVLSVGGVYELGKVSVCIFEQALRLSVLSDSASIQDKDTVTVYNRIYAMRNDKHSRANKGLAEHLLYERVGLPIYRCGGLVEDEDACLAEERARKAHQLPLPHGQILSALRNRTPEAAHLGDGSTEVHAVEGGA